MATQYTPADMDAFKAAMRDPAIGQPIVELALIEAAADRTERAGAMTPATERSYTRQAEDAAGRARSGLRKRFVG